MADEDKGVVEETRVEVAIEDETWTDDDDARIEDEDDATTEEVLAELVETWAEELGTATLDDTGLETEELGTTADDEAGLELELCTTVEDARTEELTALQLPKAELQPVPQ